MKFEFKGNEFYIDGYLAAQLNSIAYNLPNDWDIVLLVTGDRSVRVGKSVLAMTVCAYFAHILNRIKPTVIKEGRKTPVDFNISDIYFDNQSMINDAQDKEKYSINLYDEGREGLAASKAMRQIQQDLIDFFTECGQLNQIFVIVAPDFFELKEYMSVGRAEALINVYRKEKKIEADIFRDGIRHPIVRFDRGNFEFFSRNTKRTLYDKAKSTRRKNYGLVKADFVGRFTNQYPLGETEYKEKKRQSLDRFNDRHKEDVKPDYKRTRDQYILDSLKEGLNYKQICENIARIWQEELEHDTIYRIGKEKGVFLKKNDFRRGIGGISKNILIDPPNFGVGVPKT